MEKISKKLTAVLIIVVCIAVILCIKLFMQSTSVSSQKEVLAKMKGEAKAPIQITEFIDFQCPSCAHGSKELKEFMEEHPGMIRLEVKYFPLKMHEHAVLSARYAECAAQQNKFWPFQDFLMERQGNWKRLIDVKPAFEVIAKDVGLDLKELVVCLEDETVDGIIQKNKEEGEALGVKSTPTYFINREMVVGAKSLKAELDKLIEEVKN